MLARMVRRALQLCAMPQYGGNFSSLDTMGPAKQYVVQGGLVAPLYNGLGHRENTVCIGSSTPVRIAEFVLTGLANHRGA
jgi:hypothetical protein